MKNNLYQLKKNQKILKLGWLLNMSETSIKCHKTNVELSAVNCFFIREDGNTFKIIQKFKPYFYIYIKESIREDLILYLMRRYEELIYKIESNVSKMDFDNNNNVLGLNKSYIKLLFYNQKNLRWVKKQIYNRVIKKKNRLDGNFLLKGLLDIREYDLDYISRFCIDLNLRVGSWFEIESIKNKSNFYDFKSRLDLGALPKVRILAYNIETSKKPLKFPDADQGDQITMISYIINDQGFLIVNRDFANEDVEKFEYTPKPEYKGIFKIFNESNEQNLIQRFFSHIYKVQPHIYVTYNGDWFDWPFIEKRSSYYNINMNKKIGIYIYRNAYVGHKSIHIDCFYWIKRDSCFSQSIQGLKNVIKKKLAYNPIKLDPELITPYARDQPQELATYLASDSIAIYYLFNRYIKSIIFSLCKIIPLRSSEILRKPTAILCEAVLMAQAFKVNIIFPNKSSTKILKFKKHSFNSEIHKNTHVGHLKKGIFREDFPYNFLIRSKIYDKIIMQVPETIKFFLVNECKRKYSIESIINYEEIRNRIQKKLIRIKSQCRCFFRPLIYGIDIITIYPNIILTNKPELGTIIKKQICALCNYNRAENICKYRLLWKWSDRYFNTSLKEIKNLIDNCEKNMNLQQLFKNDITGIEESKIDIINQRKNSFYIDTVKLFRNKCYNCRRLIKLSKDHLFKSRKKEPKLESKKLINIYDSLQLAYKCILNILCRYIIKQDSKWYSMSITSITTNITTRIIQEIFDLCERIGNPLDFDIGGIWTCLPGIFPEKYKFTTKEYKKINMEYPRSLLNMISQNKYINQQFQILKLNNSYQVFQKTNCFNFFKINGPYLGLILSSSIEEENLRKKYIIWNKNGSIDELKGFKIKRQGEFNLIKVFQEEVLSKDVFLKGRDLQDLSNIFGLIAKKMINILDTNEKTFIDVFDLITENKKQQLGEYSIYITCIKRLAQFLDLNILKEGYLSCKFIISKKPTRKETNYRTVPTLIFSMKYEMIKFWLKRWLNDHNMIDFNVQTIIDWNYYRKHIEDYMQNLMSISKVRITTIFKNNDCLINKHLNTKKNCVDLTKQKYRKSIVYISRKIKRSNSFRFKILTIQRFVPKLKDNFNSWHLFSKQRWRQINVRWKKRKNVLCFEKNNYNKRKKTNAFYKFMDKQIKMIYSLTWQIIQISNGRIFGQFIIWAFIFDKLQLIPIIILREIYINLITSEDTRYFIESGIKVFRIIPRKYFLIDLYKLEIPEHEFYNIKNDIILFINHPKIQGIYGVRLPLNFKIVCELGCLVKVCRHIRKNSITQLYYGFKLNEIEHIFKKKKVYMDRIKLNYKLMFFYHSKSENGKSGIFGLFIQDEKDETKYKSIIIIVRPSKNTNIEEFNIQNFASEIAEKEKKIVNLNFKREIKNNFKKAFRSIEKKLFLYKYSIDRKATIIVSQTYLPIGIIEENMPYIKNKFPIIQMPFDGFDENYPSIHWYTLIIKQIVLHLIEIPRIYQDMIEFSRFLSIPIGNIPQDKYIFGNDVLHGRILIKQRKLWWITKKNKLCLRGNEEDEIFFENRIENQSLINPSFYQTICIKLNIENFSLNVLIKAEEIFYNYIQMKKRNFNEIEIDNPEKSEINFKESFFNKSDILLFRNAFKSLKVMINIIGENCIVKKKKKINQPEIILSRLYQWIKSFNSKFYDPILHIYIHDLIKEKILNFQKTFQNMGTEIVYCTFTKIIIDTRKLFLENSIKITQNIIESFAKLENRMFELIHLDPDTIFSNFLFLNEFNFVGYETIPIENNIFNNKCDKFDYVYIYTLNMSNYLPHTMGHIYETLLSNYSKICFEKQQELLGKKIDRNGIDELKNINNNYIEFRQNFINKNLSHLLFNLINEMNKYCPSNTIITKSKKSYMFPQRFESHSLIHNPSLEFIKYLSRMLILDKECEIQIRTLRRNLLSIIEIKDMSTESEFFDPSSSFILYDLECQKCNCIRDLDLCKDIFQDGKWVCDQCKISYNRNGIETRLLEIITYKNSSFQIKESLCNICNINKNIFLGEFCACSNGVLKKNKVENDFKKRLQIFLKIAKFYSFSFLLETIKFILKI